MNDNLKYVIDNRATGTTVHWPRELEESLKYVPNVKNNDRIRLCGPDGAVDPTIFKVVAREGAILKLIVESTRKPSRIHQSRVVEVLEKEGTVAKIAIKPESPREKIDFGQLKKDGKEIWSKGVENFDHADFRVEAHVVIEPDEAAFEVFNTYNGFLGKKNKSFQRFTISDIEKKRTQLRKKGYKKR